jgi:hypothetical protein
MDNKKIPTSIGAIVLIVIAVTVSMFIWVYEKNQTEQQIGQTMIDKKAKNNNLSSNASPMDSQENESWMSFDSKKDTGLSLGVRFNYPATWSQNGSRDSDAVSIVPFFDKSKYSKQCKFINNGATSCFETGGVAQIVVSNSSHVASKINYGDQKSEKITIDGQIGTKISGIVKEENLNHIASVGQKETRVVLTGFEGQRYEFIMVTENPTQNELLNEIIKSTIFENK